MNLQIPPEEAREVASAVLTLAFEKSGIVQAIKEATELQLALRGYIDKPAAAKFLRIEERTLEVWMRAAGDRGGRGVPHMKIGETVRFTIASLEAWGAQYEVNKVLPKVA